MSKMPGTGTARSSRTPRWRGSPIHMFSIIIIRMVIIISSSSSTSIVIVIVIIIIIIIIFIIIHLARDVGPPGDRLHEEEDEADHGQGRADHHVGQGAADAEPD